MYIPWIRRQGTRWCWLLGIKWQKFKMKSAGIPQAQQVLPSRVRIRSPSMGDMVAYLDDDALVDAIPISRKLLLTKVMKTRDCPDLRWFLRFSFCVVSESQTRLPCGAKADWRGPIRKTEVFCAERVWSGTIDDFIYRKEDGYFKEYAMNFYVY